MFNILFIWEILNKTTLRLLLHLRMLLQENKREHMQVRVSRMEVHYSLLLGMKTDVATLEISVEVSQKAKNQITPYHQV